MLLTESKRSTISALALTTLAVTSLIPVNAKRADGQWKNPDNNAYYNSERVVMGESSSWKQSRCERQRLFHRFFRHHKQHRHFGDHFQ